MELDFASPLFEFLMEEKAQRFKDWMEARKQQIEAEAQRRRAEAQERVLELIPQYNDSERKNVLLR
jgi:hypothetical protein